MKTYAEMKIEAFIEKSNPERYLSLLANRDSEINMMWQSEKENKNVNWQKIKSNKDVIDLIDDFDNMVKFVEENVPFGCGHIEDAYNMALAEYKALQGLRKLAKFMNYSPLYSSDFIALSNIEIDKLFEQMDKIVERMNFQNQRRAMQD